MKKIAVRAPGRVCLFGDHQDYLGLPIIACAIDRYMTFEAVPNGKEYFEMVLPDVGQTRIISYTQNNKKSKNRSILAGWLRVARAPWMCSFGRAYGNAH
ncbi:MAG: galactokinase family protein [Flavobacteriaceae bacterium]